MNTSFGRRTLVEALPIRGSRSANRVLAVAAVLGMAACGGGGSTPVTGPPPPPPPPPTGVVIYMSNLAFHTPNGTDSMTVAVGTSVVWTNSDGVLHDATSDSVPAGSTPIDTGELSLGQSSSSYTLSKAGRYVYHCEMHPVKMAHAVIIAQ